VSISIKRPDFPDVTRNTALESFDLRYENSVYPHCR
jgi:hypothetical protein